MRKRKFLRIKPSLRLNNQRLTRRVKNAPVKSLLITMATGMGTGIAIGYLAGRYKD